jgi:cyanophycin synthetase
LAKFDLNRHNLGRANLFKYKEGQVFIDYGHNPAALESIIGTAGHFKDGRLIGVLGLPGDRVDDVIKESAQIAARGFDYLIVKEDVDLRGRKKGEVARIITQVVKEHNPRLPVDVVLDEKQAVCKALSSLSKGDFLVIFYEKFESITQCLGQVENISYASAMMAR